MLCGARMLAVCRWSDDASTGHGSGYALRHVHVRRSWGWRPRRHVRNDMRRGARTRTVWWRVDDAAARHGSWYALRHIHIWGQITRWSWRRRHGRNVGNDVRRCARVLAVWCRVDDATARHSSWCTLCHINVLCHIARRDSWRRVNNDSRGTVGLERRLCHCVWCTLRS